MSSRIRALSSSVDFFVPVATTTMPKSCNAEITDQLFTPPVNNKTRLPFKRAFHGSSAAWIRASSRAIIFSVRSTKSASFKFLAKSRNAWLVSLIP